MSQEAVWVRTCAIAKALGKEGQSPKKEISSLDWDWTRALLLSGHTSSPIVLQVDDEDCEFHQKKIELPAEALAGPSPCLLPSNERIDFQGHLPPDDLIVLTHLHEPAVVCALKKRFEQDLIYTATGPILMALNPYKELPGLYDDDVMGKYWAAGERVEAEMHQMNPHVYGTSHGAFRTMMAAVEEGEERRDQSILVSGESGAGKTVTTKHIMKYLATLSQRKAEHAKRHRAPSPGRSENVVPARKALVRKTSRATSWKAGALIEEKILESNPVLEAFGNARTMRNDNSSRFGKFVELQFKHTGSLIGASIETYLLEKVRLIHQGPGERNFHVFYEMLAAATPQERAQFFLGDYTARDFRMTCASQTFDRRDGANDSQLFDQLVLAMRTLGFDPDMQMDIFGVATAFLHASNLGFVAVTDDSSKVDNSNPHLEPVLKLLGLEKDAFQSALCEFDIEAGNMSYTRHVNKELAEKGLEALIKGTYGAMFSYIAQSINKKIDSKSKGSLMHGTKPAANIYVLDIFGFESFPKNSFEQLCINYCNEALQQQFNLFVFKTEQEEYRREEITWEFIEFPDNQDVLDLIDQKMIGILSILTDQCRAPRGTDSSFADAMYKTCGNLNRFQANDLQRGHRQFSILHYAGPVTYETEGFVEKNKDEIPRGASRLLQSSKKEFVQLLGKMTAGPIALSDSLTSSLRAKKRPTVASQFKAQLVELRGRIDLTIPHYIRCLKPNQSLQPNEFDKGMIADQLRNAGVLEAIRVSRVGYSQRFVHELFLERYRVVAVGHADSVEGLANAIAKMIWSKDNPIAAMPADILDAVGIQKGATKVFLRQTAYDFIESLRSHQLDLSSTKIQSASRGFIARRRFLGLHTRLVMLQALVRGFLTRKELEMKSHRAVVIQSMYRCKTARDELHARQEEKVKELEEQLRKAAIAEELASTEATVAGGENDTVQHAFEKAPEEPVEIAEVRSELTDLKSELTKIKAELKATKKEVSASKARVAELEAENKTMKQQMEITDGAYRGKKAEHYGDHPELHKLAEGIYGLTYKSKQSKSDLDALVKALEILK